MGDVASNTLADDAVSRGGNSASRTYNVAILTREEVMRCKHWAQAFATERKDNRYYELVEDTIQPEFDFRYFAIQDASGEMRAAQPFFLLDQDMLAGTSHWMQSSADFIVCIR